MLTQIKQLGGAVQMYADDADDNAPSFVVSASNQSLSAFFLLMDRRYLPRDGMIKVGGTSVNCCRLLICPEGDLGQFGGQTGVPAPPRWELGNAWTTFRNGGACLANTHYGPSNRYGNGNAVEPLCTHYDFSSAYGSWWGMFGSTATSVLPFGIGDPTWRSRQLGATTKPDNTCLAADNTNPDLGLKEVTYPHRGLTRNYAYIDGHVGTLKPTDVDGNVVLGGYYEVADTRFLMIQ